MMHSFKRWPGIKNIWKTLAVIFIILFFGIFIREDYPLRIYKRLSNHPPPVNINPFEIIPFKYYTLQRISLFNKFDCHNKIVFIGDSLTDGCEWNELLGRKDIVNRGINADSTIGILNRLDVYLKQKPKYIFIMVGTNDIYQNVSMETIQSNYSKIIRKILENHVPLVVQLNLYTNFFNKETVNEQITILNDYLVTQCQLLSVPYIDLNDKLSHHQRLLNRYSNDGLHLNADGYIVWRDMIAPYVVKIPSND